MDYLKFQQLRKQAAVDAAGGSPMNVPADSRTASHPQPSIRDYITSLGTRPSYWNGIASQAAPVATKSVQAPEQPLYPRTYEAIRASGGKPAESFWTRYKKNFTDEASGLTGLSNRYFGDLGEMLGIIPKNPTIDPKKLAVPTKNRPIPAGVGWRARKPAK